MNFVCFFSEKLKKKYQNPDLQNTLTQISLLEGFKKKTENDGKESVNDVKWLAVFIKTVDLYKRQKKYVKKPNERENLMSEQTRKIRTKTLKT